MAIAHKPLPADPTRNDAPRLNERPESELDFGIPESGRIGDEQPTNSAEDAPRTQARAREAGRTGGEMPGRSLTADDHAPGTLIDDSAPLRPASEDEPDAADTTLSETEASRIGGGTGLDEAELARRKPYDGAKRGAAR